MTTPTVLEQEPNFASALRTKLEFGKRFWKPLHDRMDYWLNMYLLLDVMQQSKPLGFRRFISNDPRVAIDKAQSVLTTNDAYWRIDMPAGDCPQEEREGIAKLERSLAGLANEVDEQFLERLEMPLWKQAAWFGLMRGYIWGKFHITSQALEMGREAPLISEMYDPRTVYPFVDGMGLSEFIAEKYTTLADLINYYPGLFGDKDLSGFDPTASCIKLEYWSNDRPGRKGRSATLVYFDMLTGSAPARGVAPTAIADKWLIPPYEHGLPPNALPVVGVPVNGVPIKTKPAALPRITQYMHQRSDLVGQVSWHDPSGWVAESGRGLLSTVEENIPQYNELVATALQHFSIGTFGQWIFNTFSGEVPEFEEGMNAKIPLKIGETGNRVEARPINDDAWKLLSILRDERQRGTLADIIQAASGFQGTGALFQQVINAARHGLEPYEKGMVNFGSQMGSHILAQFQIERNFKPLSLTVRTKRTAFRLEFNPATDLQERKYSPRPVFKPALPEDLLQKAQIARFLLDPKCPIMSLVTVLDEVFMVEDPEGEIVRMLWDVGNRDPIILLERLAQAFEEDGHPEFAAQLRQKEFQQAFAQEMQTREMLKLAAGGPEGGAPGLGPETGAASATGGGEGRPGQGQPSEGPSPTGQLGI